MSMLGRNYGGSRTSTGSLSDSSLDNSLLSELGDSDDDFLGLSTRTATERLLQTIETFAFGALFAIVSRTSSLRIVSILVLLIEFGQLAAFAFAPIFEWGPWADSSLQPVLSVLSLRVVFSSFHVFRVVNLVVYAVLLGASVDAAYVGLALRDHSRSKVWPLRLLRYAVGFAVTVLYIPIMSVLLTPLACDYEAEPPVLRDYSDVGCWEVEITAYRMVSGVLALVFLVGTAALSLVYFQDALGSGHLLARPHARVDCATHVVKTVLLFGFATGAGSPGVLGGLLVVTMISIFVLQVLFMALYNLKLQLARTGGFLALAWLGSMALATVSINGRPPDDGVARGSNTLFVVALALVPIVACAGGGISYLRLHRLWRRHAAVAVAPTARRSTGHRSRFILVTDVELVARMHMASGNIDAANSVFRAGFDQFPNSVFVVLCYVRFLASVGNTAMAHAYLDKSLALPAWIDLRFARYRKMREVEQAQLARGLTTGSMDLVSYVQFENMLRTAKSHHNSALRAVSTFWRTLLRSDRAFLEKSAKLIARIDESERTANNYYRQLVRKYPTAPGLLSAYATFLDEVSNKPALASRFLSKAKRVEAATRDDGGAGVEHLGQDADYTLVNGAVDALISLSETGSIISLNTHARKLLGYSSLASKGELVGQPFGSTLLTQPFASWQALLVSETSDEAKSMIVPIRHRAGTLMPVVLTIVRMGGNSGSAPFVMVLRELPRHDTRVVLYTRKSGRVVGVVGPVSTVLERSSNSLTNSEVLDLFDASGDEAELQFSPMAGWLSSLGTASRSNLSTRVETVTLGSQKRVPMVVSCSVVFGSGNDAMGMICLEPLAAHTLEIVLSPDGRILACASGSIATLLGVTETEVLGQGLESLFRLPESTNDRPAILDIVDATHSRAARISAEVGVRGVASHLEPVGVWIESDRLLQGLMSKAKEQLADGSSPLPLIPPPPLQSSVASRMGEAVALLQSLALRATHPSLCFLAAARSADDGSSHSLWLLPLAASEEELTTLAASVPVTPTIGTVPRPASLGPGSWGAGRNSSSSLMGDATASAGAITGNGVSGLSSPFDSVPQLGASTGDSSVGMRRSASGVIAGPRRRVSRRRSKLSTALTSERSLSLQRPGSKTTAAAAAGDTETMSLVSASDQRMVGASRARILARKRMAQSDSDVATALRGLRTRTSASISRLQKQLCLFTFAVACLCVAVFVASTILVAEAELKPPRAEWAALRLQAMSRTVSTLESLYLLEKGMLVHNYVLSMRARNISSVADDVDPFLIQFNQLILGAPEFIHQSPKDAARLLATARNALSSLRANQDQLADTSGLHDPGDRIDKLHSGEGQVALYHFVGVGELLANYPNPFNITSSAESYNLEEAIALFSNMANGYLEYLEGLLAVMSGAVPPNGGTTTVGGGVVGAPVVAPEDMVMFAIFNGRHTLRTILEVGLDLEQDAVAATMQQSIVVVCSLTGVLVALHLAVVCFVMYPAFRKLTDQRKHTVAVFLAIPKVTVSQLARGSRNALASDGGLSAESIEELGTTVETMDADGPESSIRRAASTNGVIELGKLRREGMSSSSSSSLSSPSEDESLSDELGSGLEKSSAAVRRSVTSPVLTGRESAESGSGNESVVLTDSLLEEQEEEEDGEPNRSLVEHGTPMRLVTATPTRAAQGTSVQETPARRRTPSRVLSPPQLHVSGVHGESMCEKSGCSEASISMLLSGSEEGPMVRFPSNSELVEEVSPPAPYLSPQPSAASLSGARTTGQRDEERIKQASQRVARDVVEKRQWLILFGMVGLAVVLAFSLVSLVELRYMANVASATAKGGLRMALNEDVRGLAIETMIEENPQLQLFATVVLPYHLLPWTDMSQARLPDSVHVRLTTTRLGAREMLLSALDLLRETQQYFALNADDTFKVPSQHWLNSAGTCLRYNTSLCRKPDDRLYLETSQGLSVLVYEYVALGRAVARAPASVISPLTQPLLDIENLFDREMLDGLGMSTHSFVTSVERNALWEHLPLVALVAQLVLFFLFLVGAIVPLVHALHAQNRRTMFMLGFIPHDVVTSVYSVASFFELDTV
ncbi:uncharacterized protein AMSG_02143 [Thecamonas trahens ATCC 50062]|uniref:PAS domain-containing protein n=1 Tax=Thecamonas trahens ATCC 50062 TaxID=461836 RepID=A0A0L0DVD8_THETB|nr:hypothetical protein AMSG_02143 [Thecamonas trahens ATCC 50062]KNC56127.1 hypothetical protein AMSG_02143 [Thecamonas trahens ATCC 50062]|eukprot:XP_013761167.1 hypothetical protein AMSG_02143 [Thecamonas trahens ATCC 50062]